MRKDQVTPESPTKIPGSVAYFAGHESTKMVGMFDSRPPIEYGNVESGGYIGRVSSMKLRNKQI